MSISRKANRQVQGIEETTVAHEMDVQISSNDDEAPRVGRQNPAAKDMGVLLGVSKACAKERDTGARRDVILVPAVHDVRSAPVVIEGLRPRQVVAANLLVQGRRGKDVAAVLGVSAETVSRWRQQPEFQALMHRLLQETIDTTRLGIVSLCAESIDHLRGLLRSLDDATSLKAVALVLSKVGPVLGVIGAELRQPSAQADGSTR